MEENKELNTQIDDNLEAEEVDLDEALRLDTKAVGKRLKALRRLKDMTQAEMGRMLNCKQATISAYEDGRIAPSLQVIFKVGRLFNLDLNWLIRGDDPPVDSEAGLVVREDVRFAGAGREPGKALHSVTEETQELNRTQKELIELQKKYIELLER